MAGHAPLSHHPEALQVLGVSELFVEIPDALEIEGLYWAPPDPLFSQQMGDEWLKAASTAVLKVPSAIVPDSFNFLINPQHPLSEAIKIAAKSPLAFDRRLLSAPQNP